MWQGVTTEAPRPPQDAVTKIEPVCGMRDLMTQFDII